MAAHPTFRLRELTERLGGEAVGEVAEPLEGVASLEAAGPRQVAFLANLKYRPQLATTKAGAVILGPDERDATALPRIVASNPYAYYARAVALFNPPPPICFGVHPTAVVDPTASIAATAEVGPHVVVGASAVVGERCVLGAGGVVGEGVTIGEDTRLHPRVTLYPGTRLGARCILHSGVVVGADGFGMAPEEGRWVKIPQVGGVRIGDDVEIGANTAIDRGALDDTVIEEGVKLDNLIQIAHNCVIGAHTVIAGCAGLAGSARIGRHCRIGGAAGIAGHLTICDHVTISAMTLVTKSIHKPGTYTAAVPLMPHEQWLKWAVRQRREPGGER